MSEATAGTSGDTRRYVTFPLGSERFALDSSRVKELVMAARVHPIPHTTRSLEGVLVRHGAAIPVCNPGAAFASQAPRNLYVIARCRYAGAVHTVAIPVSGACELVQGELVQRDPVQGECGNADEDAPAVAFAAGQLRSRGETLPLLDLDGLIAFCIQTPLSAGCAGEARP